MPTTRQEQLRAYFIQALKVLDQKISYLETISSHPASTTHAHFEPTDAIANFFTSISTALLTECCCLIINHLHNPQGSRFSDFHGEKAWADILKMAEYKHIKFLRDKFAGHQDQDYVGNDYPVSRSVGELNPKDINALRALFNAVLIKFQLIESALGWKYHENALTDTETAKDAALHILNMSKPSSTNDVII